jgi:hypothetical protein
VVDEIHTKLASPVALALQREQIVKQLTDAFAADVIDMDEFDRRLDLAHQANEDTALMHLVQDLPQTVGSAAQESSIGESDSRRKMWVVLSSVSKDGPWQVPPQMEVKSVFGATVLDFRQAHFESPRTQLQLNLTFGNIEIIVPPWLAVELGVTAIMGSVERKGGSETAPVAANAVRLLICGRAIFSSVEVLVRLPGESYRDAKRRLKAERRHQEKIRSLR